jgi:GTP cyclohydrolase FolE2
MSRYVEVAAQLMSRRFDTLEELAREGVAAAAARQRTDAASLSFEGRAVIFGESPVTGRRSPEPLRLVASAELADGTITTRVGVGVAVMTACPCTLAYSHHSAILDLADAHGVDLAESLMASVLTYTHSQRAEVLVEFEPMEGFGVPQCLEALDEATTIAHELLKRPDEHHVVRAAHQRPQFTEDVVRDTAVALARRAPVGAGSLKLRVEAQALESIHAHDVRAEFVGTVGDVLTGAGGA